MLAKSVAFRTHAQRQRPLPNRCQNQEMCSRFPDRGWTASGRHTSRRCSVTSLSPDGAWQQSTDDRRQTTDERRRHSSTIYNVCSSGDFRCQQCRTFQHVGHVARKRGGGALQNLPRGAGEPTEMCSPMREVAGSNPDHDNNCHLLTQCFQRH
jgi:hypothetical protein